MRAAVALLLAGAVMAAEPRVRISCDTHPAVWTDFSESTAPLVARPAGDEPPTVRIERREENGRGGYAHCVNEVSGGAVGIGLGTPGGEQTWSVIEFDYRADPRLKVNLFARVQYQDYEIGFTGPPSDTGRDVWLGAVEGTADGQWHHAVIPLLRLLRRQVAWSRIRLTELGLENRHQGDYLLAGFGGNGFGTTLDLDNLYLGRPGPRECRAQLEVTGERADGFAVVADQSPATIPPAKVTGSSPAVRLADLPDGVHWLHVRAHGPDGWGPTSHRRLDVDGSPPQVTAPEPADGARACPARWRCRLADAGVGVEPKTIEVTVGDKVLGVESPALAYEPVAEVLTVDLPATGLSFAQGEQVNLKIRAGDENGQVMAKPASFGFTLDRAQDREGPEAPAFLLFEPGREQPEELPGDGTFEAGIDEWRPFGPGGTVLDRTDETAASGRYSLKLTCTENGSPFSCFIRRTPFDAGRFRLVSFDYRVPDRLRVDFLLRFGDQYCRVQFTDRDQDESLIGAVPGVVADDRWHHAEFDLYELLRKRFPQATDFTVAMLLLTGGPWQDAPKRFAGNYAGTRYFIDNFQLVPMLGADVKLGWRAVDMVGVAGAEVVTAADPAKLPAPEAQGVGRRVTGPSLSLESLAQGLVYVWARLLDPAGNASPPLMMRMMLDTGRPVIGRAWPADGSRAAPESVGVEIRDDQGAGLDLASLRLVVAGQEYAVDQQVLAYDTVGGRLVWDGRRADIPVSFTDGQVVEVALKDARDLAGNRPAALPSWRFTMDWKLDRHGPVVEVTSRTHAAYLFETFDARAGPWTIDPPGAVRATVDDDGRGEGGRALWLEPAGDRAGVAWSPLERAYAANRFDLLKFDYQLPPGAAVSLVVQAQNKRREAVGRAIVLTGRPGDLPVLAKLEGIVADGRWHAAYVPLQKLLAQDQEFGVPYMVERVGLACFDGGRARIGLDDFTIYRESSSRLTRLRWSALDETGVQGYSWVLDQEPRTTPAAAKMTDETEQVWRQIERGRSWFHVRAVDGAGNWGPTTHFLLETPER